MNDTIVFRPLAAPYLIGKGIIVLFFLGAVCLLINGIIESNTEQVIVSIIGLVAFPFLLKISDQRITLGDEYIHVPLNDAAESLVGQKEELKIFYSDVVKMELSIGILQWITITCKDRKKLSKIYVKSFTEKQVYEIIEEIVKRVQNKNPDVDVSQLRINERIPVRDFL